MFLFDQPAKEQECSERQHNEDEGDDESQGHDERVELWRTVMRKNTSRNVYSRNVLLNIRFPETPLLLGHFCFVHVNE